MRGSDRPILENVSPFILPSHSYLVNGGVRRFDPRHEDTDRDGRRSCRSSIERSYERLLFITYFRQECGRYGGSKAIPQISLLVVCDKDDAEKIYQAGLANAAMMQLIRDN